MRSTTTRANANAVNNTTSKPKATKGSVQIKNSNDRLQLVWTYAGCRRYLSLDLSDTPQARKIAQNKATQIELDILSGNFDESLAKYKQSRSQAQLSLVKPAQQSAQLDSIWTAYTEFKSRSLSQSTIARDYARYASHIAKLPTKDLTQAITIRDHLVKNSTPNTAKRCLTNFSAACNWAVGSGLISENPFKGMAEAVVLPKSQRTGLGDIQPFTVSERDLIIATFNASRDYCHYTSFVQFLFKTGCRPSEAIALQWKHISRDFSSISFEMAVTVSKNGLTRKSGLKTQERRRFNCNASLKQFLSVIKPDNAKPEDLVFPSPNGKFIDFNNFRNRGWKSVLRKAGIEYRNPYQTRHTFITLMLENGLDAKDVARLVGNSAEVIYRHYAASNITKLEVPDV